MWQIASFLSANRDAKIRANINLFALFFIKYYCNSMADVTISQLTQASPNNSALIPITQAGSTYAAPTSSFQGLLYPKLLGVYYSNNSDITSGFFSISIASPGWKNVTNISNLNYNTGTPTGLVSFKMWGYISSGTYWWIWRLFNNTTGQPCEIYKTPLQNSTTVVRFRTPVHGWAEQYPATFIVPPGNNITLQVAGSRNSGDSVPGSEGQNQTIYLATVEMFDGLLFY